MMTASLADMTKVLVEANNETIHTIDHVEDLRNPNQVPMDEIEAKVAEEFHISIEEEPFKKRSSLKSCRNPLGYISSIH